MSNERHIASAFDRDLEGVQALVLRMAGLVEAALADAATALETRDEAMAELYLMNINSASLFPGLDGLARSLAYELEHHWAFDPKTTRKRKGFSSD